MLPLESRLAKHYRPLLVAILLVAAALRLYGLNNLSPPGLEHDEVAHWLINRDILAGNHAVYFGEAYGHEAAFHYYQTAFVALLGDNAMALRLPAAFSGLLVVAVSFAFARRLLGLEAGVLAAGLLASLLWPVFYSRLGLRAIFAPLLSGLSALFWWYGWRSTTDSTSAGLRRFALGGLFAGLSIHTYMASRALPIFYLLYSVYLFLFHRTDLRRRWQGVVLFFIVFAIVAAPLLLYLLNNPGVEARISEVNGPLLALLDGDPRAAIENSVRILGMFGLRGDHLWRQNVASLPVFDPLTATLFYIGLLTCLARWSEPRHLYLLLWLFTASIPSIVTIDAPSSIRIINALPVLACFIFIAFGVIHRFPFLSTVSAKLSPRIGGNFTLLILLGLFIYNIGRTTRSVFWVWPAADEVQFVWQQALTDAADFLDASKESGPVAVGGWTPETMDPPTISLTLRREDLSLRYFNPTRSLIIPTSTGSQLSRIIRPAILPLDPALESQLSQWGVEPRPMGSFVYYEVDSLPLAQPQVPAEVRFGDELTFLGYAAPSAGSIMTFWRVEQPPGGPRRFFLHQLDGNGHIVSQADGLGAPAEHWQPGDIVVQLHQLEAPPDGSSFTWQLGVYVPTTGLRLLTASGADFVYLADSGVE